MIELINDVDAILTKLSSTEGGYGDLYQYSQASLAYVLRRHLIEVVYLHGVAHHIELTAAGWRLVDKLAAASKPSQALPAADQGSAIKPPLISKSLRRTIEHDRIAELNTE